MSTSRGFRPEVQGLRALAVLSVVFYHLGWKWIEGGFVGVDVFFVISGFLITGIIKRATEKREFNYLAFTISRVRRLYPALVITLALAFALGAWLLSPAHLKEFARSTLWALGSSSNFFFLSGKGYWGTAQEFQPLLHTWSLGVEVQFYVVWPVFIWAAVRFLSPRNAFLAVIAAAVVSLALAEYWIAIDSAAQANPRAFFLMPARIVEFAIGGALVWFIDRQLSDKRALEAMTTVGAVMIVTSALFYTEAMHFPGWTALIPCIGTALIIYAGGGARWSGWLFRSSPAIYIGNVSYALYLVHWPIIVFYSYYKFAPRTLLDDAIILTLCFALAALLHVAVEKPFQGKTIGRFSLSPPVLLGGVATVVALISIPAAVAAQNGWTWRFSPQELRLIADASSARGPDKGGDTTSQRKVLLLGDSHALNQQYMLSRYFKSRNIRLVYRGPNCTPLPNINRLVDGRPIRRCIKHWAKLLDYATDPQYEAVIIASRWTSSTTGTGDAMERGGEGRSFYLLDNETREPTVKNSRKVFEKHLRLLAQAVSASGRPLLIFGQVPPVGINMGPCLARPGADCKPYYTRDEVARRLAYTNDYIAKVADEFPNAHFINSFEIMCPDSAARFCPTVRKGHFLYYDEHHLTYEGARSLAPLFAKELDAIFRPTPGR